MVGSGSKSWYCRNQFLIVVGLYLWLLVVGFFGDIRQWVSEEGEVQDVFRQYVLQQGSGSIVQVVVQVFRVGRSVLGLASWESYMGWCLYLFQYLVGISFQFFIGVYKVIAYRIRLVQVVYGYLMFIYAFRVFVYQVFQKFREGDIIFCGVGVCFSFVLLYDFSVIVLLVFLDFVKFVVVSREEVF